MINILQFIFLLLTTVFKFSKPGGAKAIVAENICLRQQLITLTRTRERSPNLSHWDRFILALCASLINAKRLSRISIILKPATLIKIHKALVRCKYRKLFSNTTHKKPGRKGPSQDIINLVLEFKRRNPRFGNMKIAMQISNQFGITINSDVVRRILNKHYKPVQGDGGQGPSWLTFLGHTKDSLWSIDFFRCESITLQSHWVMIIIDQFSRRIIGFAAHNGDLNGPIICRMFNKIILGKQLPKRLSMDNDPLFKYSQWQRNLRVLEIEEIKSVPYVPMSHPFIERAIQSVRVEMLDHVLFWTDDDLQNKLDIYQNYFNDKRSHMSLDAKTPRQKDGVNDSLTVNINKFRWGKHLRGLVELPVAA